jgi:hypothetical protein
MVPSVLRLLLDIKLPVSKNFLTQGLGPRRLKDTHDRLTEFSYLDLVWQSLVERSFSSEIAESATLPQMSQSLGTRSMFGRNMWVSWTAEGHTIPLRQLFRS